MTYDCGVYDWNLDRNQNHCICVGTDDEIMVGSFAPEASHRCLHYSPAAESHVLGLWPGLLGAFCY